MNLAKYGLLCVLFFITFLLSGQEFAGKIALNTTGLNGVEQGSVRLLPQLGIIARLGDVDGLHFSSEFLFSFKGAGSKSPNINRSLTTLYNEIALMLCYTISQDITLKAGFQPGVLIYGTLKESSEGDVVKTNISSNVTRFDYSTLIGGEYRYNQDIVLGIRLNYSFVPMVKYNNPIFNNEKLYLWRGVELYATYDIFEK